MFQEHVLGVSSVFRSMLHVFDLDVANGYVASLTTGVGEGAAAS
jgi:hypothetical protein